MIIAKELIDASINSKRAEQEAQEKAMREAIESKIGDVLGLTEYIKDIMDTYRYVSKQDKGLGELLWALMCREAEELGLDFCNAIMADPAGRCGVRPHYNRTDCYGRIYVTSIGVFCGENGGLIPLDKIMKSIKPESCVLRALSLLIEAVPAYKERVSEKFSEILKKQ